MKRQRAAWILVLTLLVLARGARTQDKTQPNKTGAQVSASPNADAQKTNIQEYIELLRSDVRQQKAEMMGAVMQLSAADAAKFWPIYSEYDADLTKVNDLRAANIQEYADSYSEMTDTKLTSSCRMRWHIKSSAPNFLPNTMTASNRHWGQLRQRASFRSKTNCF